MYQVDEGRIWRVENDFVIADKGGMWLPGIYADKDTAQRAFALTDEELHELNQRICHVNGEDRPITMNDLQSAKAA